MAEATRKRRLLIGLLVALGLVALFLLDRMNREEFVQPQDGTTPSAVVSPTFTPAIESGSTPTEPAVPAGVLDVSLPGCEGELSVRVESAVSQRSAEKYGWDLEHVVGIADGSAQIEGLHPLQYSLYVGDNFMGRTTMPVGEGARFEGACSDDCALSVEVLTDGCAEDVLVDLEDGAERQVDSRVLQAGVTGASVLWTELTCRGLYRVRAEASGCTPVLSALVLREPLHQSRLALPGAEPYPVRVVDGRDGEKDGRSVAMRLVA